MAITRTRRPTGQEPVPIKRTRRPTGGTATPVKTSTSATTTTGFEDRAKLAQEQADKRDAFNAAVTTGTPETTAFKDVGGSVFAGPETKLPPEVIEEVVPPVVPPQDNNAALLKMFQDMMTQNNQGYATQTQGFTDKIGQLSDAIAQMQAGTTARNEQLAAQRQSLNEQLQRINDPEYFQNALAQVMQGYQPLLESQQRQIGEQYGDLATETQKRLDIDQARRGVFPARFSAAQTQEALGDVEQNRINALNDAMARIQGQATGDVRNLTNQQLQSLQQIGSGLGVDLNALVQQGQLGLQGAGLQGDLATKGYQIPQELQQGQQRIDLQERQVGVQESAEGRQQSLTDQQLQRGKITNRYLEPQLQQALTSGNLANAAQYLGVEEQAFRNKVLPDMLENNLTQQQQQIVGQELANIASEIDLKYFKPVELEKLYTAVESGELANAYQTIMNSDAPEMNKAAIAQKLASASASLTNAAANTTRANTDATRANTEAIRAELSKQQWDYSQANPKPRDLINDMSKMSNIIETQFMRKDPITGEMTTDTQGVATFLENMGKGIMAGEIDPSFIPMIETFSSMYNIPMKEPMINTPTASNAATGFQPNQLGGVLNLTPSTGGTATQQPATQQSSTGNYLLDQLLGRQAATPQTPTPTTQPSSTGNYLLDKLLGR